MIDRTAIRREAVRAALQVRRDLVIAREQPANPFEISEALGIDVWFTDTPSLEGMYVRAGGARILLPSLAHRPLGRISFSCAHELGHAQLEHGDRIDQYLQSGVVHSDPEELAADAFASALLMPRPAVLESFSSRRVDPPSASGLELLTIAFELGVGLDALIQQMRWTLEMIDGAALKKFARLSPKSIRGAHFGARIKPEVVIPIDEAWRAAAVDLEVGQAVAFPAGLVNARALKDQFATRMRSTKHDVYVASRAGICVLDRDPFSVALRVANAGFRGRWKYRYLSDEGQE